MDRVTDCEEILLHILSFVDTDDANTQVNLCLTCKKLKRIVNELRSLGIYWIIINTSSEFEAVELLLEKKNNIKLKSKMMIDDRYNIGCLWSQLISAFDVVHIAADILYNDMLEYCKATSLRIYGKNGGDTLIDSYSNVDRLMLENVHDVYMKARFSSNVKWYVYGGCKNSLTITTNDKIDVSYHDNTYPRYSFQTIKKLHIDAARISMGYLPYIPDIEELTLVSQYHVDRDILRGITNNNWKCGVKLLKLMGVTIGCWSLLTERLSHVWTNYEIDPFVKVMYRNAEFIRC
jgi:hypothetical protein